MEANSKIFINIFNFTYEAAVLIFKVNNSKEFKLVEFLKIQYQTCTNCYQLYRIYSREQQELPHNLINNHRQEWSEQSMLKVQSSNEW